MNDGQCIDGVNDFTCKCKPGWTGALCNENINECKNNSCQHGSECIDQIAGYICQCREGYTGKHCQTNINDCSINGTDPCKNGGIYS